MRVITKLHGCKRLYGYRILPLINILLVLLFVFPAHAERRQVFVGSPSEKKDININFANTENNVAEIYRFGVDTISEYGSVKSAIESSEPVVVFRPGVVYVVDGGITSSVENRVIIATGATIRLKNSASNFGILHVTGRWTRIIGGTWDGNRENNSAPNVYQYWNIRLAADGCSCIGAKSINSGIGIRGDNSDDLLISENKISNTILYGIYISSAAKTTYRNVVESNVVDMSQAGITGQGILLTSGNGHTTEHWQILNNNVTGVQGDNVPDLAINIAVRGHKGVVSGNTTRYGSMGFSEGGDNTVIANNKFLDVVGTCRYGVEFSGRQVSISDNVITGAHRGVITSGNASRDQGALSGNIIECSPEGVGYWLQPGPDGSAKDISISGGVVNCRRGVTGFGDISNLNIHGVSFVGPGSNDASSVGIALDTTVLPPNLLASANIFRGFRKAFSIYDREARIYSGLHSAGNVFIDVPATEWQTGGDAQIRQTSWIRFD